MSGYGGYDPNMFSQFGGYPAPGAGGWYGDPNSPSFMPGPDTASYYGQGGGQGSFGGGYNPYANIGGQGGGYNPYQGNPYASTPQVGSLYGQPGQQSQQPPQMQYQSPAQQAGHPAQQNPVTGTGTYGAPNPASSHPVQNLPFNQSVGEQLGNQTMASGGQNAVYQALFENGLNPAAPGVVDQMLLKNADRLTNQATLQSIMSNGKMDSATSMRDVLGKALTGQNVFYGGNSGQDVYNSLSGLAQGFRSGQDPSATASMAYNMLFGPGSESNVADLLYGTQGGPMGSALQQSVGNMAALGQLEYEHPGQYGNLNFDPSSWLQAFLGFQNHQTGQGPGPRY